MFGVVTLKTKLAVEKGALKPRDCGVALKGLVSNCSNEHKFKHCAHIIGSIALSEGDAAVKGAFHCFSCVSLLELCPLPSRASLSELRWGINGKKIASAEHYVATEKLASEQLVIKPRWVFIYPDKRSKKVINHSILVFFSGRPPWRIYLKITCTDLW